MSGLLKFVAFEMNLSPSPCKRGLDIPLCPLIALLLLLLAASIPAAGQANCSVSQSTFDTDVQYATHPSPTHLSLMRIRYVELRRAERGLACSGVPLVAFDGLHYRSVGQAPRQSDDPGLYVLAPALARFSGMPVEQATDVLVVGAIVLLSAIGLLGYLLQAKTRLGHMVGIAAFLLIAYVELHAGDVYALGAAPIT